MLSLITSFLLPESGTATTTSFSPTASSSCSIINSSPLKELHDKLAASCMALLYKIMIYPSVVENAFTNVLDRLCYPEEIVFDLLHELVSAYRKKTAV